MVTELTATEQRVAELMARLQTQEWKEATRVHELQALAEELQLKLSTADASAAEERRRHKAQEIALKTAQDEACHLGSSESLRSDVARQVQTLQGQVHVLTQELANAQGELKSKRMRSELDKECASKDWQPSAAENSQKIEKALQAELDDTKLQLHQMTAEVERMQAVMQADICSTGLPGGRQEAEASKSWPDADAVASLQAENLKIKNELAILRTVLAEAEARAESTRKQQQAEVARLLQVVFFCGVKALMTKNKQ